MQKPTALVFAALSLALTLPLLSPAAQAVPGALAQAQRGGGLKKMASALGLTDAQKAQMKPILQDSRRQSKAIKEDTALSADARKAKLKELRKSTLMQTMSILTPEQRTKLKSLREAKREAKKGAA